MRPPLAALALAGLVAGLAAWSSFAGGATAPDARAKPRPLPGLPQYTAGYRSWWKLNARPIRPRASDPHLGTKNVYASRLPPRGTRFPAGTVIVKEATRPGSRFLGLIAVMRKLEGSNPRHNDWQMIEWTRSSPRARFSRLAEGQICTSCHVAARRKDYVFVLRVRNGKVVASR